MFHKIYLFFCLILSVTLIYWFFVALNFFNTKELRVSFLNVGQGDSILIQTPNSKNVLIDAGKNGEKTLTEIENYLDSDSKIDIFFITHFDSDHSGGALNILKRYDVEKIFTTFLRTNKRQEKELLAYIKQKSINEESVSSTSSFVLDDVEFYILWPSFEDNFSTNTSSIFLLIKYGNNEIVLTGDLSSNVEDFVVNKNKDLFSDIEILKAGHHGSKHSTSTFLLKTTSPDAVVYSYGKNSYGHPSKDVLSRVKAFMIQEFHTFDGSVSFCLDKITFRRCI